jgi:hypothetical protein
VREPEDRLLRVVVQTAITLLDDTDALFLIDKDYQIRRSFSRNDIEVVQATRARAEMLHQGTLLAVVSNGWDSDTHVFTICEYYPEAGHQPETYVLTHPRPVGTWTDQDEPEAQAAIEYFKNLWSIDAL